MALLCLCGVFLTRSLQLAGEMPLHFPHPAGSSLATEGVSPWGALSGGVLVVMKVQLKSIQRTIASVEAVYEKVNWYEFPSRKLSLWWRLRQAKEWCATLLDRYRETCEKLGLIPDL